VGGAGSSEGGSSTIDPPNTEVGGGSTEDPPNPVGDTTDPPAGDTGDPPGGDTGDPPGGDTGDPPGGDTGDPPGGDTGDPPGGDTPDPPEGCTMTEIDKVNVIVFKDATPTGADVEGKMWVGGNATFSGYSVATKETGTAPDCSYYGLVVGGTLSGQVNANKGKVAVGSMGTGQVTSACGITRNQTVVDFAAVEKKLKGYSAAFRDYPTNGTVSSTTGGITLTGTDKNLNVFSVTAAQLTGTGTFKLVVPTTSSVIINVSGVGPINWSGVGFQLPDGASCRGGTSDWCHNILFNFYEATSIALSGIGVQGSVMAPYAKISGSGGNIDGQLVCDSLIGGIEYHPYFFTGCLLLNRK
jgi:choice-of-anchor A domain-containing protein